MGLQVVLVDEFPMEFDCAFVCPFRIQVVLVEELPMEFWRMSSMKCVFERWQMNENLCFPHKVRPEPNDLHAEIENIS